MALPPALPLSLRLLTPFVRWALRRILRRVLKARHGKPVRACSIAQRVDVARQLLDEVHRELAAECKVAPEALGR